MAMLYWFALIAGGGMLAASFFGDVFETDTDAGGDAGADTHATKLLSLRHLTYFLFGFGATGLVLRWSGALPALATAVLAALVGLAAAWAAALVLDYVQRTASGEHEAEDSFVGCTGRLTLPFGAEHAGRVVVTRGAREYELRARPFDAASAGVAPGAGVVVVHMEGGTALVAPLEGSLPAPGAEH
jgi:membrane protein implicated in regulation of membrane protease activity